MIKINYQECDYLDLINIISDCQKELLENRGTLTSCKILRYPNHKKAVILIDTLKIKNGNIIFQKDK